MELTIFPSLHSRKKGLHWIGQFFKEGNEDVLLQEMKKEVYLQIHQNGLENAQFVLREYLKELNDIGMERFQKNEDGWKDFFREGLRLCSEKRFWMHRGCEGLKVLTWNNMGMACRMSGDLEKALSLVKRAYAVKKRYNVRTEEPGSVELNMVLIFSELGNHLEALKLAKEALNVLLDEEVKLMKNNYQLENCKLHQPLYQNLILAHHYIAMEYESLQQSEIAAQWHFKAYQIALTNFGPQDELTLRMKDYNFRETYQDGSMVISKPPPSPMINNLFPKKIRKKRKKVEKTVPKRIQRIYNLEMSLSQPRRKRLKQTKARNLQPRSKTVHQTMKSTYSAPHTMPQLPKIQMVKRNPNYDQDLHLSSIHTSNRSFSASRSYGLNTKRLTISAPSGLSANDFQFSETFSQYSPISETILTESSNPSRMSIASSVIPPSQDPSHELKHRHIATDDEEVRRAILDYSNQQKHLRDCACLIIQQNWRGFLGRKKSKDRRAFIILYSTLMIQSAYRAHVIRSWLSNRDQSVQLLQRNIRSFLHKCKVKSLHSSATCIQCAWRQLLASRRIHRMQITSLLLQSWWRKIRIQNRIKRDFRAATIIQGFWRMCRAQKHFHLVNISCCVIQQHFRNHLSNKEDKDRMKVKEYWLSYHRRNKALENYRITRNAIIKIQSTWRAYQQRKVYLHFLASANKLRHFLRGIIDSKVYTSFQSALPKLQACAKRHYCLNEFQTKRENARKIQSWWKGEKVAISISKRCEATKKIQYFCRTWLLQKMYHRKIKSAICIQKNWRRYHAKVLISNRVHAVQTISRFYQKYKALNELHLKSNLVLKLQGFFRLNRIQKRCRDELRAVTQLQAFLRMVMKQRQKAHKLHAALYISSVWRCYSVRIQMSRAQNAAIKIQSVWRGYFCRLYTDKELRAHKAVAKCGIIWKSKAERNRRLRAALKIKDLMLLHRHRKKITHDKRAAIKIQSIWRGFYVRYSILKLRLTVWKIQRWVRWLRKRREADHNIPFVMSFSTEFEAIKRCATIIQRNWRMLRSNISLSIANQSADVIQRAFNAHLLRKSIAMDHYRVSLIQAFYRGKVYRRELDNYHQKATMIQVQWRRFQVQTVIYQKLYATLILQRSIRSYLVRRRILKKDLSSIIATNCLRRCIAQKKAEKRMVAICRIQGFYHLIQLKRRMKMLSKNAMKIQSRVKAYQQVNYFKKMGQSALIIQTTWRRFYAMAIRNQIIDSSIIVQRMFRMHLGKLTVIRFIHGIQEECDEQEQDYLTKLNQSGLNEYIKNCAEIKRKNESATKIQAIYRGYLQKLTLLRMRKASNIIISLFKSFKLRKKFRGYVLAASKIQHCYRGYKEVLRYQDLHSASVRIQTTYRLYRDRKNYRLKQLCSIIIQRNYFMGRDQSIYSFLHYAATRIQVKWRGIYSRVLIAKRIQASVNIQRVWRGYSYRKQLKRMNQAAFHIQNYYYRSKGKEIIIQRYREYPLVHVKLIPRFPMSNRNHSSRLPFQSLKKKDVYIPLLFMNLRSQYRSMHLFGKLLNENTTES